MEITPTKEGMELVLTGATAFVLGYCLCAAVYWWASREQIDPLYHTYGAECCESRFACTLPPDHAADHVAHGPGGVVAKTWPQRGGLVGPVKPWPERPE